MDRKYIVSKKNIYLKLLTSPIKKTLNFWVGTSGALARIIIVGQESCLGERVFFWRVLFGRVFVLESLVWDIFV